MQRFWARTQKLPNGCIVSTYSLSKNGYATFGINLPGARRQHTVLAHRWLFERCFGPLPADVDVMHSCDNRACLALQHLSPGTRKRNMEDAVAKGRHSHGVGRPKAKLDDDKVRELRKLYATGRYSQQALADYFGVHQVAISLVLRGKTWKHVK